MSTPAQLTKALAVALTATLLVVGCSDPPTGPSTITIVVDKTELSLLPGDSAQLYADVREAGTTLSDAVIRWTTSDSRVATVSLDGLIRAVAPGDVTITGEAHGQRATVRVTVRVPAPVIEALSPSRVDPGAAAFTLRVTGRRFEPASRIHWGGAERPTTFVSATELTAQIAARDAASDTSVPVAVKNPESSGGVSEPAYFVVGQPFRATRTTIAAGDGYTCVIDASGSGRCWGDNVQGRFGVGQVAVDSVPARVATDRRLTHIATSNGLRTSLTCALTAAGAALCWGANNEGQLGTGPNVLGSDVPVEVAGGHTFVDLAVGVEHACAVTVEGAVYCWGNGDTGQLGDGQSRTSAVPVRVPDDHHFVAVVAGEHHSCALTGAGAAYCWGDTSRLGTGTEPFSGAGVPPPPAIAGVTAAAGNHVFKSLTAALDQTCGLRPDGQAFCWGGSRSSGFRFGAALPKAVPGTVRFTTLDLGQAHACGTALSGGTYCWGLNGGRLGDGTTMSRTIPTPVTGPAAFRAVAAGEKHSCAIDAGGSVFCWGEVGGGLLTPALSTAEPAPARVAGGLSVRQIRAGLWSSCALDNAGSAYCWGSNRSGQLGIPTSETEDCELDPCVVAPMRVPGTPAFRTLAFGSAHTCAATEAGEAYCWGANLSGQLGDGTTARERPPIAVVGGLRFRELMVGGRSSCGITFDDRLFCWGEAVPVSGSPSSSVPRLVAERTYTRLLPGAGTCALNAAGALYCWGTEMFGQLAGAGTETCTITGRWFSVQVPCSSTPVRVAPEYTFTDVADGGGHRCGITTTGVTLCWGDDSYGKLGATTTERCNNPYGSAYTLCSRKPLEVRGGHTFTAIAAASSFTCALTATGSTWCWGNPPGTSISSRDPVRVEGPAFVAISAGQDHVCARTAEGQPYCWGPIHYGQLGTGRRIYEAAPVRVSGVSAMVPG